MLRHSAAPTLLRPLLRALRTHLLGSSATPGSSSSRFSSSSISSQAPLGASACPRLCHPRRQTFPNPRSQLTAVRMTSSASSSSAPQPLLPDSLHISQLSVRIPLGVDSWERLTPHQPVNLDIQVHTDVSKAGRSDHLPYSIHYGILVKEVEKHCQEAGREGGRRYRSLEGLAVSAIGAMHSRGSVADSRISLLRRTALPRSASLYARLPR